MERLPKLPKPAAPAQTAPVEAPREFDDELTDDKRIARWCVEMLARGDGSDMVDVRYVRGCARYEADNIRPTRPDLATKLDAVVASLTARLPEDMR